MEQFFWLIWIILGIVLIIAEIFTFGFVLFWFGIGALAAALAGFLGFGLAVQFVVFALVSIGLTVMSRKIFVNFYAQDEADALKTGIATLPGQIGMVTNASHGALKEAAVKVYGSTWTAFPAEGEAVLEEGEKVEVVRVQGSSIYVRKVSDERELPEWRKG